MWNGALETWNACISWKFEMLVYWKCEMEHWKRGMHAFTGNLKCWYAGNVLETWNACIYWKFEMLVYWKRGMHAFTGNTIHGTENVLEIPHFL